jgi:hypothetical protein
MINVAAGAEQQAPEPEHDEWEVGLDNSELERTLT